MNQSCRTYEYIMSHRRMRHVTSMNESCPMYEQVIPQIWMSHVPHRNDSRHAQDISKNTPHTTESKMCILQQVEVDLTHWYVGNDLFFFGTWLVHTWHPAMIISLFLFYYRAKSPRRIYIWDMTHSYLVEDSFMNGTWLFFFLGRVLFIRDYPRTCYSFTTGQSRLGAFTSGTWLIHIFLHASFIFATLLIHTWDIPHFFWDMPHFFFGHESFVCGNPWCVLLLLQGEVAWDFFTEGYEPLRLSAVYPRPHTRVRNNSVAIILSFSGVLHPGCNPNRFLL